MSLKGEVEAKCPKGCEPFTAEVWSFIRGDRDAQLREAVVCREANLLLCPACGEAFIASAPFVYFEPSLELMAFVFPESYKEREQYWRTKMHEDFLQMKQALGPELPLDLEPSVFFGPEGLSRLLEEEDYRGEEREVMECLARELGLSLYRVSPRYSREKGIPASLPYPPGRRADRASVLEGLEKLLKANDRLEGYAAYRAALKTSRGTGLPPAAGRSASGNEG